MREIKFRVWYNKKIHIIGLYTSLLSIDPGVWEFGWDGDGREGGNMKEIDGKNLIMMQYTGLKDSKGKDIYEGDIVTGHFGDEDDYDDPTPETKMTGYVEYDFDGFTLKVIQKLSDKDRLGMVNWFGFSDGTDFFGDMEVIGNIYESKHLLDK